MKELSVGDSVSIGGKNYTIGSTVADAQKIVDAQKKAGGKVTINGAEYTYDNTTSKWKDANNQDATITIGAGDKVSDGTTTLTTMTDKKMQQVQLIQMVLMIMIIVSSVQRKLIH